MLLSDIATIRTGMVVSRVEARGGAIPVGTCRVLSLRCLGDSGVLDLRNAELRNIGVSVKDEFLTWKNDVLIRLSAPYSSALIAKDEECGLVVPSYFAIIRMKNKKFDPAFVLGILRQDATKKAIVQEMSGNGFLSTIKSSFFGTLSIPNIAKERQIAMGRLVLLADKEQELLRRLAKQKAFLNKNLMNRIYKGI